MYYKVFSILCASSLPFLFSLNGEFVFDDSEAITKNPDVFAGSWLNAFKHDFWGAEINTNYSHKSYRPLTILTFRLNYYLNDKNFSALQYKITNLFLHITCSLLVWKTLEGVVKDVINKSCRRKWYDDEAFLASLLFAIHPIHTEAVSGIVGRADLLAGNTFFLALLFYQKAMNATKLSYLHFFSAIAIGSASMLFKENGITVLGFCCCYELLKNFHVKRASNRRHRKRQLNLDLNAIVRLLGIVLVIGLSLYARWKVMGHIKPQFTAVDNPAAFSRKLFTKIATYNYIYFLNLLLFIWPQWLCYDWSMGCVPLIRSTLDYRLIFVLLMYLYGAIVLRALISNKYKESTKRLMIIALLMAVIPFLPASNIFYTVGFVLAERILYIPTAGYSLFLTLGIQKLNRLERDKRYKITPVLFCLLLLILGMRTWIRAENWRNEYQLFINGVSVCPLNAKIHYNIAKTVDNIDKKWSMEEYNEAIRLYPRYYQAMNNLGNLLKFEKRYSEAEIMFKTALQIKQDFPVAWMNLGIVLASVNRNKESEAAYTNALRYRRNYPECFFNLGNLYLQMNNTEKALQCWLQATRLNSTFTLAWYNSLTLLYDTGQLDRGRDLILKAIEALPNVPNIHFTAGNLYGIANNYTAAEKHFKTAIKLLGNDVKAIHYGNLGVLYHRWKKHPLAAEMYQKALKIDPQYEAGRKYLDYLEKFK